MKKNVRLIKSICLAFMLMLATVIPYTAVTANSTGVVINTTTQDANPTDSLINGMDGEITQSYDYSFVKTEKWKEMKLKERITACQIPDDTINSMTTETLLNSVLDYPFMIDLLAYDTCREGFLNVYANFPALQKLLERNDLGNALKSRTLKGTSSNDILRNIYCTILISQPEIENKLSDSDANTLKEALEGDNITLYENAQREVVAPASAQSTLYTPNGTAVTVINNSGITDWSSAQKSALNQGVLDSYPSVYVISDPSKKYNCHSYAWYSTSTSNYYWMDDPSAYMTDGSYSDTGLSLIVAGDKVHWDDGSHSGIISYVGQSGIGNIKAKSKWGQLGVYDHYFSDCPYTGSTTTYRR